MHALFFAFLSVPLLVASIASGHEIKPRPSCEVHFTFREWDARIEDLKTLQRILPNLVGEDVKEKDWFKLFSQYVDPLESPLMIATVTGNSKSRKSTLVNYIEHIFAGKRAESMKIASGAHVTDNPSTIWTPTDLLPGTTRRGTLILGQVPPGYDSEAERLGNEQLENRIPGIFKRVWQPDAPLVPGEIVLARSLSLPPFFGVKDTPGFDVSDEDEEAAFISLGSADVVILMVSNATMKNQLNRKILRDHFQKRGVRRMILVVTDIHPNQHDHIRPGLRDLAMDIYAGNGAEETPDGEMPDGLLGVYAMPYDLEVWEGKRQPVLNPLNKNATEAYPSFEDLLDDMDHHRTAIKAYGLKMASATIVQSATTMVRARVDSAMAARVLLRVSENARAEAAHLAKITLDAHRLADDALEGLDRYRGEGVNFEKAFDLVTFRTLAEKWHWWTASAVQRIVNRVATHGARDLLQFKSENDVNIDQAAGQFFAPLRAVAENDSYLPADGIMSTSIVRLLRDYAKWVGLASDRDGQLQLPKDDMFDEETRRQLKKLLEASSPELDPKDKSQVIGPPPFHADLKKSLLFRIPTLENERFFRTGFFPKRNAESTKRDRWIKVMIFGSGVVVFAARVSKGPWSAIGYGYLTMLAGNQIFRSYQDRKLREELSKKVSEYMKEQADAHLKSAAASVEERLRNQAELSPEAETVQQILHRLDPSFEILPIDLDASGDAGDSSTPPPAVSGASPAA